MIELIAKTRLYLDYLEAHYNNIQKAFKVVENKCSKMRFIYDDFYYHCLRENIKKHDEVKLSKDEFVQYRTNWFPVACEKMDYLEAIPPEYRDKEKKRIAELKSDYQKAWTHHIQNTNHHAGNIESCDRDFEIFYAEMVIDWIAMSYYKGGTALEYYEDNKSSFDFEPHITSFVEEILARVYGTYVEKE